MTPEAAFAQSTGGVSVTSSARWPTTTPTSITLFTEFPFCLTDHTGDAYSFSQVFCILPTLLVLLAGLVVKVGQLLNVKNRMYYFLFGMTLTAAYPSCRDERRAGAQPDWFGLIFAFAILLLTLDFRFDTLEPARFGLIFLATAAIILARRWFLYFVVGYYFRLCLLARRRLCAAGKGRCSFRRPPPRGRTLSSSALRPSPPWSSCSGPWCPSSPTTTRGRYSYYNGGGLALEAFYHLGRLGLFNLILIALGLVFAAKRKLPALPCLAGCELVIEPAALHPGRTPALIGSCSSCRGISSLFLLGARPRSRASSAIAPSSRRWAFVLVLSMSGAVARP